MDVQYEGTNALAAAANGDFPLVVLLWGMAMAVQPQPPDLLTLTDADGNSLLHYVASGGVDTTDTLHFLLQQAMASGHSLLTLVDARNSALETPLMRAAHAGNLRIVEALLTVGHAAVLAQDAAGNTAAHHAAAQGHLWVLHYLLEFERRESPADVALSRLGGRCIDDNDVLFYACVNEHKALVQYLLKRGYDPNRRSADGTTCLDLAQRKDAPWMVDLLAGEQSADDTAPSEFKETRAWVALLYGAVMFAILAMSYVLPWWLAVPVIALVLAKSLAGFRHGGGGHSHGAAAPTKSLEALHPSKRDVRVAASVPLARPASDGAGSSSTSPRSSRKASQGVAALLKPQPEMAMGIWIAWVAFFTLFHVALWVDVDYTVVSATYTAFVVIVLVLHVALVALWLRLAFVCPSDPGVIRTSRDDVPKLLADAAQGVALDPATHCRTCLVAKPLRSKHCAKCGVCIARLDHHCTWINRCVGYGNHRLFVAFLLLHTAVLVGYVALAMLAVYESLRDLHAKSVVGSTGTTADVKASMSWSDAWVQVPAFISGYLLVVMVLVWGLLALGALSLMTKQHVMNITTNITVNEQINWRRYAYLTAKPNGGGASAVSGTSNVQVARSNPFDRGVKHNVREFFTRSGRDACDYRAVFRVPSPKGVATVPETHRSESKDVHFRGVQAV